MSFIVGVDLGQAQDYTAIAVVESLPSVTPLGKVENTYHLRYLERPELGTLYPAIVQRVIALLGTSPLSVLDPLVVDQTGVGRAVVDMFADAGVRPRALTITGGNAVTRESIWQVGVPKRELVGTLVALYQTGRLKTAEGLLLAPVLTKELVNFKLKVNLETGHDSYEAWRESNHDDLVLAVAMSCWWGENMRDPGQPVAGGHRPTFASPYSGGTPGRLGGMRSRDGQTVTYQGQVRRIPPELRR